MIIRSFERCMGRVGIAIEQQQIAPEEVANVSWVLYLCDYSSLFRRFADAIPTLVFVSGNLDDFEDALSHSSALHFDLSIVVVFPELYEAVRHRFQGRRTAVLEPKDLSAVTTSTTPKSSLRVLIRSLVPIGYLSPYNTNYVTPHTMFFGRQREIADIDKGYNDNYVVVGPRRIGKSSLAREIQRIRQAARGPMLSQNRYAFSVAYADCNLIPDLDDPEESLFEALLSSMKLEARDTFKNRHLFGKRQRSLTPFEFFKKLVEVKYKSLTVIVDEVDGLLEADRKRSWKLLRKFQGLVDQVRRGETGTATPTNVILVGFTNLYQALYDQDFPFYGRCKLVLVGNLDRSAVESLVTEPMVELGFRMRERQQILDRIMNETGGMPSIVQSVCGELTQALHSQKRKTITPDLVQGIIEAERPLEDYTNWFDFHTQDLEKLVVYFMGGNPQLKVKDLVGYLRRSGCSDLIASDLFLLLDNLALANILRETVRHEVYEYAVDAFRRTIANRLEDEGDKEISRLLRRVTG